MLKNQAYGSFIFSPRCKTPCYQRYHYDVIIMGVYVIIAAAASEPEANERGSSLISRRLHYRGLQSLFLTKRKELWLCTSGSFRMPSGMPRGIGLTRD